jgi:3-hydroxyisobutyrate dehydrogenase-like beta-hydroxyacid dehydrogenase
VTDSDALERPTVGIVSPGAMGSAVGHVVAQTGARVVATVAGRSPRTQALAARAGLELVPDLTALVHAADVVLSIVPPGEARAAAADIAGAAGSDAPLLVELNAIAPATVRDLATLGLDLVDGSISGPPPWSAGTTRIYLSGPRAQDVVELGFPGVELVVVGDEVGVASAVKMCTASIYKGTLAVFAEALRTAHAHGVVHHVLDDVGDAFPHLVERPGGALARAASVAGRYVGEMHEIAATQGAAGLPTSLFEAMADVYADLARRPLAAAAPEEIDRAMPVEDALAELG